MMTFRTGEIARALNISPRRLTSAMERGLLSAAADPEPGTGNRRNFQRQDVHRFALMTRLSELGIGHSRASVIANLHAHACGVLIVEPSGSRVQSRSEFHLPESALFVDLDALRAEVDARLAAVA